MNLVYHSSLLLPVGQIMDAFWWYLPLMGIVLWLDLMKMN